MARNLAVVSTNSALLAAMDTDDVRRLLTSPEVPNGTPEDLKLTILINWVVGDPAEAAAKSRVDDFIELSSECLVGAAGEPSRVTQGPTTRFVGLRCVTDPCAGRRILSGRQTDGQSLKDSIKRAIGWAGMHQPSSLVVYGRSANEGKIASPFLSCGRSQQSLSVRTSAWRPSMVGEMLYAVQVLNSFKYG